MNFLAPFLWFFQCFTVSVDSCLSHLCERAMVIHSSNTELLSSKASYELISLIIPVVKVADGASRVTKCASERLKIVPVLSSRLSSESTIPPFPLPGWNKDSSPPSRCWPLSSGSLFFPPLTLTMRFVAPLDQWIGDQAASLSGRVHQAVSTQPKWSETSLDADPNRHRYPL